jgi:hypothetical protein
VHGLIVFGIPADAAVATVPGATALRAGQDAGGVLVGLPVGEMAALRLARGSPIQHPRMCHDKGDNINRADQGRRLTVEWTTNL